jgi:hypothetical protein
MTMRRINLLLWTATALLMVAAAGIVAAAIVMPLATLGSQMPAPDISAATQPQVDALEDYARIWSRSLRNLESRTDAPAVASTQPAKGPGLTLAGTVGHSVALLRTADGAVHVRAVGERLAGAQVVAIEPYKVELRHDGQTITLAKPRPGMITERIR